MWLFNWCVPQGVGFATEAASAGYGAFHVFATLNLTILAGWVVLALGAWRTRVLGPVCATALGLTAALPVGVLKGTMTRTGSRPTRLACRGGTHIKGPAAHWMAWPLTGECGLVPRCPRSFWCACGAVVGVVIACIGLGAVLALVFS